MFNNKRQIQKKQVEHQKHTNVSDEFVKAPAKVVGDSLRSEQLVLNFILSLSQSFKSIFPSHATIAKATGLGIRTVQRAIGRLKAKGLLFVGRYYMLSHVYDVHELFHDYKIRQSLKLWLPFLAFFSFNMLKSKEALEANECKNGRLYYLKDIYLTKPVPEPVSLPDTPVLESDTRVRAREGDRQIQVTGLDFKKKDEMLVKEVSELLNLTPIGQELLTCFSDQALGYGLKKLKVMSLSKLHKPYAWFFTMCQRQSESQGWPIDWGLLKDLKMKHGVTFDTAMDNGVPPEKKQVSDQKEKKVYKMGLIPPPSKAWLAFTYEENITAWEQWEKYHLALYKKYYSSFDEAEEFQKFLGKLNKAYDKLSTKGKEYLVPFYGPLTATDIAYGAKQFEDDSYLEKIPRSMHAEFKALQKSSRLNWLNRPFEVITEQDKVFEKWILNERDGNAAPSPAPAPILPDPQPSYTPEAYEDLLDETIWEEV